MIRTLALELAGAVAIVYGAAQLDTAAGWIVAGALALVAAWRTAE